MNDLPKCPACQSAYTCADNTRYLCAECAHEWPCVDGEVESDIESDTRVINDAHGSPPRDGDSITVVKDLKVRGSSSVLEVGTRVRNIRRVEGDHNIDCKVPGIGAMKLKSESVRKS